MSLDLTFAEQFALDEEGPFACTGDPLCTKVRYRDSTMCFDCISERARGKVPSGQDGEPTIPYFKFFWF